MTRWPPWDVKRSGLRICDNNPYDEEELVEPSPWPALWIVWGDGAEPKAKGTEEEVKDWIINTDKYSEVLYIESPAGDEYALNPDTGQWDKLN